MTLFPPSVELVSVITGHVLPSSLIPYCVLGGPFRLSSHDPFGSPRSLNVCLKPLNPYAQYHYRSRQCGDNDHKHQRADADSWQCHRRGLRGIGYLDCTPRRGRQRAAAQ
jgi:hypothetical protein